MEGSLKISFETPAFKKSCLHTVKYFSSDVIGKINNFFLQN